MSDAPVPSVTGLWPVAGWLEREVYDLYGVLFSGNSDLRRILTDYGFRGHPLRKDFPLTGYTELRYSEEEKRALTPTLASARAFQCPGDRGPGSVQILVPVTPRVETGTEVVGDVDPGSVCATLEALGASGDDALEHASDG